LDTRVAFSAGRCQGGAIGARSAKVSAICLISLCSDTRIFSADQPPDAAEVLWRSAA
jgi:hypothetical protein